MATNVSTNLSPSLLLVEQGTAPSSPASGQQRLFIPTSSHVASSVNHTGGTTAIGGGGGGGFAFADVEAHLGSNVTLTANSMTDVLSISLPAGTWLLVGKVTITAASGAVHFTAELWDGSTHLDSGQITQQAGWLVDLPLVYKVTPGSTTTYKIRATSTGASCTALAACPQNGVGNNATTLYAFQYA